MGRYDAHKFPFQPRIGLWEQRKVIDHLEQQPKSMPCHVVKVDKDFIYVQFETQNNIFTMPTVKIPQSMSPYGREPTQVGDKGYAVPGHYYLGGVTGMAGGNTNFYPRANLTPLSFQHVSHTNNPKRDYDQLTHMGGPNGWIVWPYIKPQQQQTPTGQTGTFPSGPSQTQVFRDQQTRLRAQYYRKDITPKPFDSARPRDTTTNGTGTSSNGSSSQQQDQQPTQQDPTQFSFDKNGMCTIQSKDTNHLITVDKQNKKITLQVPPNETIYVGGDGKTGKYSQLTTVDGPVINAKGRIG